MTREELENEIFISMIRDLLFFLFVNRARDPPLYDPLYGHITNCWDIHYLGFVMKDTIHWKPYTTLIQSFQSFSNIFWDRYENRVCSVRLHSGYL